MGASKLMAPTHLMARRAQQPAKVPPAHKRIVSHTSVTVVQEGGPTLQSPASGGFSGPQQGATEVVNIHQQAQPAPSSRAKTGADSLTAQQLQDEYDPARPNEYAVFLREKRQRVAAQRKQEEEERRRAAPAPWELGPNGDRDEFGRERGGDDRDRRERSRSRDRDSHRRRSRSRSRDGDRYGGVFSSPLRASPAPLHPTP